jgi:hypothetical protein
VKNRWYSSLRRNWRQSATADSLSVTCLLSRPMSGSSDESGTNGLVKCA